MTHGIIRAHISRHHYLVLRNIQIIRVHYLQFLIAIYTTLHFAVPTQLQISALFPILSIKITSISTILHTHTNYKSIQKFAENMYNSTFISTFYLTQHDTEIVSLTIAKNCLATKCRKPNSPEVIYKSKTRLYLKYEDC